MLFYIIFVELSTALFLYNNITYYSQDSFLYLLLKSNFLLINAEWAVKVEKILLGFQAILWS